jgi:hypothetical protein
VAGAGPRRGCGRGRRCGRGRERWRWIANALERSKEGRSKLRLQARELRGAPAPFAGDQFEARTAGQRPHDHGLDDALGLDRVGELLQRFRLDVRSRLIAAALVALMASGLYSAAKRVDGLD